MKERTERISRERFIRLGGALGVSVATASVLAACAGGSSGQSANGSAKNTAASGGGERGGEAGGGGTSGETTGGKDSRSGKSEAKASGGKGPEGREIAQASKVPVNSAVNFTDSGSPAVLIHLQNGEFVAYSAVCTHQGCTVAYQPSTGELACPCHGSVFDPSNGAAVINGPAQVPLPPVRIKVQGGEVYRA